MNATAVGSEGRRLEGALLIRLAAIRRERDPSTSARRSISETVFQASPWSSSVVSWHHRVVRGAIGYSQQRVGRRHILFELPAGEAGDDTSDDRPVYYTDPYSREFDAAVLQR